MKTLSIALFVLAGAAFASHWSRNDDLLNPSGVQNYGQGRCDLGDIDGDQWPDIVLLDTLGLKFYKNIGYQSPYKFQEQPRWAIPLENGFYKARVVPTLADINGDGLADFILPDPKNVKTAKCWLNTEEDLNRWSAVDSLLAVLEIKSFFALGDIDQDGDLDAVTLSNFEPVLYKNTGSRTMPEWSNDPQPFSFPRPPNFENLRFADVNSDGNQDILIAIDFGGAHDTGAMIIMGFNKGDIDTTIYDFTGNVSLLTYEARGITMGIGDINRDGTIEIMTGFGNPFIYLWHFENQNDRITWQVVGNLGTPFGFLSSGIDLYWNENQMQMILAHLDRPTDIWPQVITFELFKLMGNIWMPVLTPEWTELSNIFFQSDPTVLATDWFSNGTQEYLVSSITGVLSMLISNGGDYWHEDTSFFASLKPDGLFYNPLLVDFNSDQKSDLFILREGHPQFYENISTTEIPNWESRNGWTAGFDSSGHYRAYAGDTNNDGLVDIVFGERDGTLSFYKNTGQAEKPHWLKNADEFNGISFADKAVPLLFDLDKDGDLDLVLGDGHGCFRAYENDRQNVVAPKTELLPEKSGLMSIYPNPFNNSATIEFEVLTAQHVSLAAYNLLGEEIEEIFSENLAKGIYRKHWMPKNAASGLYFLVLKTNDQPRIQKALLVR